MAIKITSDSTCDLSPELLERYQVTLLPLCVNLGDQCYYDGQNIVPTDIFDYVSKTGQLPTTSATNISTYMDFFEPLAKEYEAVIHINLGSGFSSCHQNARLATEEMDNVYVVDSCNLSTGQGLMVIEAAIAAQRGDKAEDIVVMLNELAGRIDTSFVVDKLDYLVKGGRCSSAAALGANLLNLKPCIEVKDGKLGVVKKYRGNYTKCLQSYIKDRLEGRDNLGRELVFVTSTPVSEEAYAAVMNSVASYGKFDSIIETTAGCTVSCHCGPGTLGIIFVRN